MNLEIFDKYLIKNTQKSDTAQQYNDFPLCVVLMIVVMQSVVAPQPLASGYIWSRAKVVTRHLEEWHSA